MKHETVMDAAGHAELAENLRCIANRIELADAIFLRLAANELAKLAQRQEPVQGWKLVPVEPNKAALIGEFSFEIKQTCSACYFDEPDDDCEVCGGAVQYLQPVTVPWTTIKEIYAAMLNAAPTTPAQEPVGEYVMVRKQDAALASDALLGAMVIGSHCQAAGYRLRKAVTTPQPIPAQEPRVKCDGDHGGPNCGDPECWVDGEPTPAQEPFAYAKPNEGDYEKAFSWNKNERTGYTMPLYTTPQPTPALLEAAEKYMAAQNRYAKADMAATTARDNYSDFTPELNELEAAASEVSSAEKELRAAIEACRQGTGGQQ
jgi:hypothetical protein